MAALNTGTEISESNDSIKCTDFKNKIDGTHETEATDGNNIIILPKIFETLDLTSCWSGLGRSSCRKVM